MEMITELALQIKNPGAMLPLLFSVSYRGLYFSVESCNYGCRYKYRYRSVFAEESVIARHDNQLQYRHMNYIDRE